MSTQMQITGTRRTTQIEAHPAENRTFAFQRCREETNIYT